jgi:hypothetical protein
MIGERIFYIIALVLGLAGGGLGWQMPRSGKNAVVLGLIPMLGFGLGTAYC